jgi:hypothetical protein
MAASSADLLVFRLPGFGGLSQYLDGENGPNEEGQTLSKHSD